MSDWTIRSLKEHFDCILQEREQKVTERFNAMQMAVTKAEDAAKERADKMNEFRGQLDDQAKTFARRELTESEFKSIRNKQESDVNNIQLQLTDIKEKLQKYDNVKQGEGNTWIYIVLLINLLGTIIAIYMNLKK